MPAEFFGYYVITASLALAGYILYFALTEKHDSRVREDAPIPEPRLPEAVTPPLRRAA